MYLKIYISYELCILNEISKRFSILKKECNTKKVLLNYPVEQFP